MHLVWTASGLVFTSMDRKIKLIEPNQNRMVPLVESSASFQVAAIACADYPGQSILVVGWTDGSIQSIQIDAANRNEGQTLFRWTSVQFALCVSTSMRTICSGGSDGRLHFLPLIGLKSASATIDSNQSARQTIDLHAQIDCVASSMSGDLVVAATVNRLFLFGGTVVSRSTSNVATHRLKSAPSSASGGIWTLIREVSLTGAPLSRLCLAPDGSRILCASTSGAVHVLKISWRTVRIKGGHQISYVGRNQINVRLVEINQSDRVTSIRSQYSIVKVRVLANRFVVVWTSGSLIFAGWRTSDELTNNSQLKQPPEIAPAESQPIVAELKWNRADEKLRFCFDFDNVILLQSGSELHVLQWNTSELLASVRTQHFSPHLLRYNIRQSFSFIFSFFAD